MTHINEFINLCIHVKHPIDFYYILLSSTLVQNVLKDINVENKSEFQMYKNV